MLIANCKINGLRPTRAYFTQKDFRAIEDAADELYKFMKDLD